MDFFFGLAPCALFSYKAPCDIISFSNCTKKLDLASPFCLTVWKLKWRHTVPYNSNKHVFLCLNCLLFSLVLLSFKIGDRSAVRKIKCEPWINVRNLPFIRMYFWDDPTACTPEPHFNYLLSLGNVEFNAINQFLMSLFLMSLQLKGFFSKNLFWEVSFCFWLVLTLSVLSYSHTGYQIVVCLMCPCKILCNSAQNEF